MRPMRCLQIPFHSYKRWLFLCHMFSMLTCCQWPDAEGSLLSPGPGSDPDLKQVPGFLLWFQNKHSCWGSSPRSRAMGSFFCILWADTPDFTFCGGRCVSSYMMPSCLLFHRCSGKKKRNCIFMISETVLQAEGQTCACLKLLAGLHEGPSCWDLEGLPVFLAALPAVLLAVTPPSPLHVSLLHGGNEAEDCCHGPGLQEGKVQFFICFWGIRRVSRLARVLYSKKVQSPNAYILSLWCQYVLPLFSALVSCHHQQQVDSGYPKEARVCLK